MVGKSQGNGEWCKRDVPIGRLFFLLSFLLLFHPCSQRFQPPPPPLANSTPSPSSTFTSSFRFLSFFHVGPFEGSTHPALRVRLNLTWQVPAEWTLGPQFPLRFLSFTTVSSISFLPSSLSSPLLWFTIFSQLFSIYALRSMPSVPQRSQRTRYVPNYRFWSGARRPATRYIDEHFDYFDCQSIKL